jgi:hypothetical protein
MKHLFALAALAFAAPALAQPPAPVQAPAPAPPAVDPARLARARTTIDYVWPLGTYQRMMSGTFDQMMDGIMQSTFDMKMGDVVPPGADGKPLDPKLASASLRDAMAKADPHFQERLRITNHVMMQEMIPSEAMLTMMDPEVTGRMSKFMPEFIKAMPQIMAKVQAATASLPPPPVASAAARRR